MINQNGWMLGAFGGGGAAAAPVAPERTRYVAANVVADIPLGNDGDQAVVTIGNLQGAIIENVAGVQTYRGQNEQPMRTTVYPAAQRNLIGTLLPAGSTWWFVLTAQDGTNNPGWYSIDSDGIQTGPHVGTGGTTTGETTRFDLTTVPILAELPNVGDQAIIISGDLAGMIFENVAGVVRYMSSNVVMRDTVFDTVARRAAVAGAMLTGRAALGSGVAGPSHRYILTQDDTANSATAGIYSVIAFDGPAGLQVQDAAFSATTTGGSGNVTPVAGWSDPSVGAVDRNFDVGTIQEQGDLIRTIIADLKTAGVFTS